ncbi:AAA+ ATPase domain [Arabidopsis suecica]|uniref:AAA-ATPase At4g25835 n=2 Tax=Arabidopsis TaxID=3701 RepID=AATPD_ARATH|nr:P-loop containing nucleoside triphosphate hydrolases superfamily protein [Arabidopsis thaliana]Q8RY66.1 RecName: Full=AAA-ATPase At4g25835; Flags: Precursor [Arabidopsis thaliana]AAL91623.1 AT4g25830/F14M19_110 [Arabidopsis thaliana]AEE85120.1 P-loop containing nucleoside triphosphate hydrolases superfamily protein [Arabidopsis thaliana]KAG7621808.1 AAA+ ATPase domain [Arabidopsis suecica]|eukprot:NP_567730.1 P-loop containing nucleoside triphosphate hydrolases superfamily protein [Arabidopsis thaliana]
MKEYWTSLASLLGVLAFCQSLMNSVFPPELRFAISKLFNKFFKLFSTFCYFDITEIDGVNTNELYNAVQLYLSSSVSIAGNRLSLTRAVNSSSVTFGLSNNDSIVDTFNSVTVVWEHIVTQRQTQTFAWRPMPEEKRGFTLRIKKKDKNLILDSYLDYIMEKANEIRRLNQDRLLYTNSRGGSLDSRGLPWESVPFKHPSTFDTLAMDPVKKQQIMEDLKDFAECQSFYERTGRAWKRGYLLYGPPGTGKSSMIAAMANYLRYDIYDLELTEVKSNSELRKLLMKTSSKSIIVIEDIDCSINLTNRNKKQSTGSYNEPEMLTGSGLGDDLGDGNTITLSGLLNFTDGLWSCCGSERIFVFTTNHIEKLDPALLRSGRMDMHIHMSYCTFSSVKILLRNYLGFEEGDLNDVVLKELAEVVDRAEITPADVSEALIKNRRDKERAVRELLVDLRSRVERNEKNGKSRVQNVSLEEQENRAFDSLYAEENGGEEEEIEDNICKSSDDCS